MTDYKFDDDVDDVDDLAALRGAVNAILASAFLWGLIVLVSVLVVSCLR